MGKSLGNAIYLCDSEEEITRKVMSALTDTTKIKKDDPANPEVCMVGYYHDLFSKNEKDTIYSECRAGARGCVNCKKQLAKNICDYLESIREKRKYYENNIKLVEEILMEGTKKAKETASQTLKRVKEAMKINYFE